MAEVFGRMSGEERLTHPPATDGEVSDGQTRGGGRGASGAGGKSGEIAGGI